MVTALPEPWAAGTRQPIGRITQRRFGDPVERTGNGSPGNVTCSVDLVFLLLVIPFVVVTLFGSVLAFIPVTAEVLCGNGTRVRQFVRLASIVAYIVLGVLSHRAIGASYIRALAGVDPEGGCGGWGEDHSGCPPDDPRRLWVIFWIASGLAAVLIVWAVNRSRAKRAATRAVLSTSVG